MKADAARAARKERGENRAELSGKVDIYCFTVHVTQYTYRYMIKSFRCAETRAIFNREGSRKFRAIEKQAQRRLALLDSAASLLDLAAIHSNHLETLIADRKGQRSIRINQQWRICFVWTATAAENVEIVDYH